MKRVSKRDRVVFLVGMFSGLLLAAVAASFA
jgi:hypothetical protein